MSWRLLIYFGAIAVISTLILGPRNARWFYWGNSGFYGLLLELVLLISGLVSLAAFVAAMDRGDRVLWLICGGGLAAIAVGSWAVVWWAERRGV